jgi:antitoxin ParD1/3/4
MKITLPAEWEQFVRQQIESGRYLCEYEVILEGLHLLREREELDRIRLEALRKGIAIGIEQIERGEYTEYDEAGLQGMLQRICATGRQRLAEQGNQSQP